MFKISLSAGRKAELQKTAIYLNFLRAWIFMVSKCYLDSRGWIRLAGFTLI